MIDAVAVAVALCLTLSGGRQLAQEAVRRLPLEQPPAPDARVETPEPEVPTEALQEPAQPPRRVVVGMPRPTGSSGSERGSAPARAAPRPLSSSSAPTRIAPAPVTARPPAGGSGTLTESLVYYVIRLFGGSKGTTTGYREEFMVFAPEQSQPRPLLVVFHRFGVGHLDAWVHTQFFQEARLRGWHVLAPLSASGVHFGSIEGQINTEAAMDWALANFNVDASRIYAVGFSMGGGAAVNFAARHQDPGQFRFAAVADHTGGISLPNSYLNTTSATRAILDFWFGDGSPGSAEHWKMMRSSALDFDPQTLQVDPSTNLARNLQHVPLKVWRASNEPLATSYLSAECDVLVSHLQAIGGQAEYEVVPYSAHEWDLLDEGEVLSWLSSHDLQMPTSGNTLADHDGKYFHFEVTQDVPGAFTPFSWNVEFPEPTPNKLALWDTANLTRLKVDSLGAGLDPDAYLEIELATADELGDEVVLSSWPRTPSAVFRDGIQVSQNWIYDDQRLELTIQETDGTQTHTWGVQP